MMQLPEFSTVQKRKIFRKNIHALDTDSFFVLISVLDKHILIASLPYFKKGRLFFAYART